MVTPAAFAAAMTSSSRIEPPGCTIADTPAAIRISGPSANGKNASEAATDPAARSPARLTARLHESTRLTWPMPTPTDAPSFASRIALDLTARQAFQANSRSARVPASAASPETRVHPDESNPSKRSLSCTRMPPEICRNSVVARA